MCEVHYIYMSKEVKYKLPLASLKSFIKRLAGYRREVVKVTVDCVDCTKIFVDYYNRCW